MTSLGSFLKILQNDFKYIFSFLFKTTLCGLKYPTKGEGIDGFQVKECFYGNFKR